MFPTGRERFFIANKHPVTVSLTEKKSFTIKKSDPIAGPDEIFEILARDILLVTRVKLEKLTREIFDMLVTFFRKDTLNTKSNI